MKVASKKYCFASLPNSHGCKNRFSPAFYQFGYLLNHCQRDMVARPERVVDLQSPPILREKLFSLSYVSAGLSMCLHTASILSPKTTCRTWHGTVLKYCNNHQPHLDPPNQNRTMAMNKKRLICSECVRAVSSGWLELEFIHDVHLQYLC